MIETIKSLSSRFGTGDAQADVLIVCVGLGLVAFFLAFSGYLKTRSIEDEYARNGTVLGRLEALEMSLNTMRTDYARSLELLKGDIGFLKQEIDDIKKFIELIGPQGGGGGSGRRGPLTGGGTPPYGSRGGGSSFSSPSGDGVVALQNGDGAVPQNGHPVGTKGGDLDQAGAIATRPKSSSPEPFDSSIIPRPGEISRTAHQVIDSGAQNRPAEVAEATLSTRLQKTRSGLWQKIREVFQRSPKLSPQMVEELEAQLIASDLGVKLTGDLIERVRADLAKGSDVTQESVVLALKDAIRAILDRNVPKGNVSAAIDPVRRAGGPLVVMMVGINGVGKTTTTAKLAMQWKRQGAKVLMVAADTFRAAAIDQLLAWGERLGVPVIAGKPEAKPATVVYDAMLAAREQDVDVVIIDTAGRLHTKANLMQELEGMRNMIRRHQSDAPHEIILVVDGSTGQNALQQAREFNSAVPLSGVVVTKLDGTPRGGIVVAIKDDLGVPVRYIGVGESPEDLRPFQSHDFVEALLAGEGAQASTDGGPAIVSSAHAEERRRKRRELEGEALL